MRFSHPSRLLLAAHLLLKVLIVLFIGKEAQQWVGEARQYNPSYWYWSTDSPRILLAQIDPSGIETIYTSYVVTDKIPPTVFTPPAGCTYQCTEC